MILEITATIILAFILSIPLGYFLSKIPRLRRIYSKEEKNKHKILNDAALLLEKIKEHGGIIDEGKILKPEFEYDEKGVAIGFKTEPLKIKIQKIKEKEKPTPKKSKKKFKTKKS